MSRLLTEHVRMLFLTIRLLAMLGAGTAGLAYGQRVEEYHLKAAVLVNLGAFVDWPTAKLEQENTFVIGVVGRDPFGEVLDQLARDQQLKGRRVMVRRHQRRHDLDHCHVVFIGRSEAPALRDILASLHQRPVLTVSDLEGFVDAGGMIGLSIESSRVILHANPRAMEAVNLSASSKLLRLARIPPPAALGRPFSQQSERSRLLAIRGTTRALRPLGRILPRLPGATE